MAEVDHWHPVLASRRLGKRPVGVQLAGRPIVLFRDGQGQLAALDDACPHRRMRLSCGSVENGRLKCPYHGWTFNAAGQGESPGTPKLHAQTVCYDVVDAHDVIWVRPAGSTRSFPSFDVKGFQHVGTLEHRMKAPLELALDNFCEIEHTATVHETFGFDPRRMAEVDVRLEPTDDTVIVRNDGPPKPISPFMRFLIGQWNGFHFHSHWTTYFSPVYLAIDHWWGDSKTGREALVRWRVFVVLTPVSKDETAVWSVAYARSRWPLPWGGLPLFFWLMRWKLDKEIQLDVNLVEHLASHDPSIVGMKLGRFDRVLGLNRDRIERLYRGTNPAPTV